MYHSSTSVFVTKKTPSGMKMIMKIPNKKAAKQTKCFSCFLRQATCNAQ